MLEIILVSQSPRRREILENAGFLFTVHTVKVSEILEENLNLPEAISQLAKTKGQAYLKHHNYLKNKDYLVVSADTLVVLDGRPLGKPENSDEAEQFLRLLSGKTHSVITGIYLFNTRTGEEYLGSDQTLVQFRELSEVEISEYVATGEPLDKAGAYAIQGEGKKFVSETKGSNLNVVGFPLELFESVLNQKKWLVKKK